MRMVFTSAPEDTYYPARGRLVHRFHSWARRRRTTADPFVVEALVDHRWADGDGLLGRWRPEDLEEALLDWFPRKVTMRPEDWDSIVPSVRAFVDFLFDEDLADRRCADRELLHAALDKLAGRVAQAMADQTRYGMAKFWATRMLNEGVDPTDQAAAQRFIADLQAGRIAVDRELLDEVMQNQLLAAAPDRHPPLPLVVVPDDAELRPLAAESLVVRRLREVVRWVGAGRALTATGRLRLADARELIALLATGDVVDPVIGDRVFKTRSSDELYGVSLLVAWARAARVVRVVKGRLVPVKSAAKVLADPLALAHRAFAALFEIGDAVCASGWTESVLRWRFDDAALIVVVALYTTHESLPVEDLRQVVYETVGDQPFLGPVSEEREETRRRLAHNDVDRLFEQLRRLGVIDIRDGVLVLTPLGIGLVAAHLREQGADLPTVESLLDETAEVVVVTAADVAPETAQQLLAAWCVANPGTAHAELRALAARTDDPVHRKLARAYAKR